MSPMHMEEDTRLHQISHCNQCMKGKSFISNSLYFKRKNHYHILRENKKLKASNKQLKNKIHNRKLIGSMGSF